MKVHIELSLAKQNEWKSMRRKWQNMNFSAKDVNPILTKQMVIEYQKYDIQRRGKWQEPTRAITSFGKNFGVKKKKTKKKNLATRFPVQYASRTWKR